MTSAFIDQFTIVLFVGLLAWAAFNDFRTYLIPNSVSFSVALLYPAHVLASPVPIDWVGALVVAFALLATGIVMFALKYAGGGDVKLLAAAALWAGPMQVLGFVLLTTMAGGVLAVFTRSYLQYVRPWPNVRLAPDDDSADKLHASIPYGIAIAVGGLWLAIQLLSR